MTNGAEIKTKEEIAELYKSNPGLAVGILFENIVSIKEKCSCRMQKCKEDQNEFYLKVEKRINDEVKPKHIKNFLMQFPGGIVGGAITVYLVIELWIKEILKSKIGN